MQAYGCSDATLDEKLVNDLLKRAATIPGDDIIKVDDSIFSVRSQNRQRQDISYIVDIDSATCDCPAFANDEICKHLLACNPHYRLPERDYPSVRIEMDDAPTAEFEPQKQALSVRKSIQQAITSFVQILTNREVLLQANIATAETIKAAQVGHDALCQMESQYLTLPAPQKYGPREKAWNGVEPRFLSSKKSGTHAQKRSAPTQLLSGITFGATLTEAQELHAQKQKDDSPASKRPRSG